MTDEKRSTSIRTRMWFQQLLLHLNQATRGYPNQPFFRGVSSFRRVGAGKSRKRYGSSGSVPTSEFRHRLNNVTVGGTVRNGFPSNIAWITSSTLSLHLCGLARFLVTYSSSPWCSRYTRAPVLPAPPPPPPSPRPLGPAPSPRTLDPAPANSRAEGLLRGGVRARPTPSALLLDPVPRRARTRAHRVPRSIEPAPVDLGRASACERGDRA